MDAAPSGVRFEQTPDGFHLHASCASFENAILRVGLAAVVSSLPFVLWWDLIRNVWDDEGLSFWMTCLFLSVWAAAIAYAIAIGLMTLFGEIRVTKAGDAGAIFTGIGKLGWTRRVRWSEWESASEVSYSSGSQRGSKTRYVVLTGPSKRYRFGWLLPAERMTFVVGALCEQVFGGAGRSRTGA